MPYMYLSCPNPQIAQLVWICEIYIDVPILSQTNQWQKTIFHSTKNSAKKKEKIKSQEEQDKRGNTY